DYPAVTDCRKHGPSLFKAPSGTRTRHLSASCPRTCAQAHFRRAAVSGTIAADGHDRGWLHRWRSRRIAPGVWIQKIRKTNEGSGDQAAAWNGKERDPW